MVMGFGANCDIGITQNGNLGWVVGMMYIIREGANVYVVYVLLCGVIENDVMYVARRHTMGTVWVLCYSVAKGAPVQG